MRRTIYVAVLSTIFVVVTILRERYPSVLGLSLEEAQLLQGARNEEATASWFFPFPLLHKQILGIEPVLVQDQPSYQMVQNLSF